MYVRELVVSYRRRQVVAPPLHGEAVAAPAKAAAVFSAVLGNEPVEVFGMLALNTRHRLIAYHEVSRGGINATMAGAREIFQAALLSNAVAVVVGHNHPSGDPTPSADDCLLTRQVVEAGKLMGIDLLDHIVVGEDGRYYSFLESGRLQPATSQTQAIRDEPIGALAPNDHARKAAELWQQFTDNERALVRIGVFPAREMNAAERDGYDGHALVVALMKQERESRKER